MRKQRQRPRVVLDLPHQEVDETGLDHESGLARRRLDRLGEALLAEPADEVQPTLDEANEVAVRRQVGQMVGAQGDRDGACLRLLREQAQELLPLVCPRTA